MLSLLLRWRLVVIRNITLVLICWQLKKKQVKILILLTTCDNR
jgi:hypothetical protein